MKKSMFAVGSVRPRNAFALSAMLESAKPTPAPEAETVPAQELTQEPAPAEEVTETAFFESVNDDQMLEAISKAAESNMRSAAAAAVIQWIEEGDAEADAFEALAYGLAGGETEELTEDEAEDFEKYLGLMVDFTLQLGASAESTQGLVDGDDDAAETVYDSVESALADQDTDELIATFGVRENLMMEAKKKVIRDGKVVTINTKKKKRRMSSAQKAALKKARSKANSSAAKAARKKSNNMRKSRGM